MPRNSSKWGTVQMLGIADVPPFDMSGDAEAELTRLLTTYAVSPLHGHEAFRTDYTTACARAVGEAQLWAANPTPSELKEELQRDAHLAGELHTSLSKLTGGFDGGNSALALAPALTAIVPDLLSMLEELQHVLVGAAEKVIVRRGPPPLSYRYTLASDIRGLANTHGMPLEVGNDRPEGEEKTFLCALLSAALSAVEEKRAQIEGRGIPDLVPDDVRPLLRPPKPKPEPEPIPVRDD